MKKTVLFIVLSLSIVTWQNIELAASTTTYYFAESFGSDRWEAAYRVEQLQDGKTSLSFTNQMESQTIVIDDKVNTTINWECRLQNGQDSALATFANGVLIIKGSKSGQDFEYRQTVDGLPWYQAGEYQLISLLGKPIGTVQEFWVINSADFKPYKLSAMRQGTETISLAGTSRPAIKIVISIAGLPTLFWRNDSWYDPDSTQYLMFRGRRGAPWTPPVSLDFLYKK